jgi:hypothetical protein
MLIRFLYDFLNRFFIYDFVPERVHWIVKFLWLVIHGAASPSVTAYSLLEMDSMRFFMYECHPSSPPRAW